MYVLMAHMNLGNKKKSFYIADHCFWLLLSLLHLKDSDM